MNRRNARGESLFRIGTAKRARSGNEILQAVILVLIQETEIIKAQFGLKGSPCASKAVPSDCRKES